MTPKKTSGTVVPLMDRMRDKEKQTVYFRFKFNRFRKLFSKINVPALMVIAAFIAAFVLIGLLIYRRPDFNSGVFMMLIGIICFLFIVKPR